MSAAELSRHERVLEEERAARKRHRDLERARREAAIKRDREWRLALREAVRELRPRHRSCRCNFRAVKTKDDLRALGGGCTMPRYGCPMLMAVRGVVGKV